jgi:ATP-dependent Clp protease ATP-binding subunit ClpB
MRFDKLTIKSQELVQNAQSLASRYGNQQIVNEHLLLAMLEEKEGIARTVLRKLGVSPDTVRDAVRTAVDRLPKVSGAAEVYLSTETRAVLEKAFDEAAKMKDEYVSIEHILLVLADAKGGEAASILKHHGLTRDNLLKVLMEIRGSQRITDPNPEEKYQALE